MKRLLCVLFVLVAVLNLTACHSSVSAQEKAIAGASTKDELYALSDQYSADGNYDMALLAVERILVLDPADDRAYTRRAQLQILIIRDEYAALNAMVEQDIAKVGDPSGYRADIARAYGNADLQLVIPFQSDLASADQINHIGNTSQNLGSIMWLPDLSKWLGGIFAFQGDFVYYAECGEDFALYKMKADGTGKQRICEDGACQLNVMGDWIYFSNHSDNYALYKIRTDGSEKTKLADDWCGPVCVTGDWIYYCNAGDSGSIYRIRTDGSDREPYAAAAQSLFTDGEWLYFVPTDGMSLQKKNPDTGGQQVVVRDQRLYSVIVYDGWIYYLTDRDGLVIIKAGKDGGEETEVFRYDAKINCFAVVKNRLIVSTRSSEKVESIVAYDLDTMEQVLCLSDASSDALCTDAFENLFFPNTSDNSAWYTIDWASATAIKID